MKDYIIYFIAADYLVFIVFVLYMRYGYKTKLNEVVVNGYYRYDDGLVVTNPPKHEVIRYRPVTVKMDLRDVDYTLTYGLMAPFYKTTTNMTGESLLNTSKVDLFLLKTHLFLKRYFFA